MNDVMYFMLPIHQIIMSNEDLKGLFLSTSTSFSMRAVQLNVLLYFIVFYMGQTVLPIELMNNHSSVRINCRKWFTSFRRLGVIDLQFHVHVNVNR